MPTAPQMNLIEDQVPEPEILNMEQPEEISVEVAIDSGATDNVTHPSTIPKNSRIEPNVSGLHFTDAGGGTIVKHGQAMTLMKGSRGPVGVKWSVAEVARTLQSVSQTTGPAEGEGQFDVLFNNKTAIVVPSGVVAEITSQAKTPIYAEYARRGGLYVAETKMSGFARQGQKA